MPLVLTERDDGLCEATSPYGYSGIYVAPEAAGMSADERSRNWSAALEILRDLRVVSLFLRFSPLDQRSAASSVGLAGLELERNRRTYTVRTEDAQAMWEGLHSSCRNKVRKAQGHGLTGSVRPVIPADLERGLDFRRLYEATMARVGASAEYLFGDAYYRDLAEGLASRLQLVEVRDATTVVASSLVMRHGDRVHYHLSGSDPDGARKGANVLLVWTLLTWCVSSGARLCHLGGGREERDGLDTFKRSFGGQPSDFHIGKCVVDPDAYARLTQARANQLGTTPAELASADFFPAFRAGE
jgi:CelD/BcsL family acetyltransferase involved in cellulose biosynthesis